MRFLRLAAVSSSLVLSAIFLMAPNFSQTGNSEILSFAKAKKIAERIHRENPVTVYCPCKYEDDVIDLESCGYKVQNKNPKRAKKLEWEHVAAAESFGQSFKEWRDGDPACIDSKGKPYEGRRCAQKNPEFAKMEADLYNLWPSIGELNGLRSNYSMAQIAGSSEHENSAIKTFGGCTAKIADHKFEPMDLDKGIVARVHMYMDSAYPGRGIVSGKNQKLFEAWDKMYPATPWECRRAKIIESIQKNRNEILASRCD